MKFGIVGGGFGYDCHFEALKNIKGAEVIGITDSGTGRLLKKISNPKIYFNSVEDLISLKPDAITIAAPPKFHCSIISKIAQKNINLLCEKPFCISTQEGLKSTLLVEKLKLANCINFQYRYEPGIQFLKTKIKDQSAEKIKSIEVIWLTSGRSDPKSLWTWRNDYLQGGGVKNAFLVHIIDLIQWLLMSEIDTVNKSKSRIIIPYRKDSYSNEIQVTAEDFVDVEFLIKNNIKVTCKVSNCNKKAFGMKITINSQKEKLIYEHKPPFRSCDQSVFREYNNQRTLLFNAVDTIPIKYKDSRAYSLRELYKKFIFSIEKGNHDNELTSFRSGYQIKKILEKVD